MTDFIGDQSNRRVSKAGVLQFATMMSKHVLLGMTLLFCLSSHGQVSSSSVSARDLAGWYATHPIEIGNAVVLDRPAMVRRTSGTSTSSGEVMLSLYEIDIDKATFRLTLALGIAGGKPLDYFAVQNVTADKSDAATASGGRSGGNSGR
jgi:hypothetical protein